MENKDYCEELRRLSKDVIRLAEQGKLSESWKAKQHYVAAYHDGISYYEDANLNSKVEELHKINKGISKEFSEKVDPKYPSLKDVIDVAFR